MDVGYRYDLLAALLAGDAVRVYCSMGVGSYLRMKQTSEAHGDRSNDAPHSRRARRKAPAHRCRSPGSWTMMDAACSHSTGPGA